MLSALAAEESRHKQAKSHAGFSRQGAVAPGRRLGHLRCRQNVWGVAMHRLSVAAGETIYRMGEESDAAFLILSGEVATVRRETTVTSGKGALIGFSGLFDRPYGATATAVSACTLVVFSRKELRALIRSNPDEVGADHRGDGRSPRPRRGGTRAPVRQLKGGRSRTLSQRTGQRPASFGCRTLRNRQTLPPSVPCGDAPVAQQDRAQDS